MQSEDKSTPVVDLGRYRKVAEQRAAAEKAKAAARKASRSQGQPQIGGKQPVLGSRPHAGLILTSLAILAAALLILPTIL